MAQKSKFQISRALEDKIKAIASNVDQFEPEFSQVHSAFILGFHYSNVTNYVGLTTDFESFHAGLSVVGLAYFKAKPDEQNICNSLKKVIEFNASSKGLTHVSDKNRDLFLIYYHNEENGQTLKEIFDSSSGDFCESQPKLSVLDETKLYNHSALTKLNLSLKLDLFDKLNKFSDPKKVEQVVKNIMESLTKDLGQIKVHLRDSNFSSTLSDTSRNATESLYDNFEVPNDVTQMGDYLPQLSKSEKQAMVEKWRNKIKAQRDSLEFDLEHDSLSYTDPESVGPESYAFQIETFLYTQVNDPIAKTFRQFVYHLQHLLNLVICALKDRKDSQFEAGELKVSTFKPSGLSHFVQSVYAISSKPDFQKLKKQRHNMHHAYLVPLRKPEFRYSQRILDKTLKNPDEKSGYLCNVHKDILDKSGIKGGTRDVIEGTYTYHHYMQDQMSDSGWGCAYRSLQTIVSWFKHQGFLYSPDIETRALKEGDSEDKMNLLRVKLSHEMRVPTHEEIQKVLVDVGDKPTSFIGSQKWIGSQEICYVLDHLYNIQSKFISVSSANELVYKARELGQHFASQSTPIMIGGGVLAHTIIGVDFNERNGDISYLILDPHYTGQEDLTTITKKGWCGWKKNNFWDKSAFYNLCLPQRPQEF